MSTWKDVIMREACANNVSGCSLPPIMARLASIKNNCNKVGEFAKNVTKGGIIERSDLKSNIKEKIKLIEK